MSKHNKRKQVPKRTLEVIETVLKAEGYAMSDLINQNDCPASEFLTLRQTADRLVISIDTVKRRLKDGSFKGKKLHCSRNGSVRVLWSSVEDYLDKHDL
jgi:hypothetical protein